MPATTPTIETVPPNSDPVTDWPRALAVRLGNRPLWLGNDGAADPEHLAEFDIKPEAVVSLTRHRTASTTDHHPLSDAIINDPDLFAAAVETTREYYRTDTTTPVHCAAGISRSATVLATALAVEEESPFEKAVEAVQQYRQRANPHPKLRLNAYDYLVDRRSRQSDHDKLATYAQCVSVSRADAQSVADRLDHVGGDADGSR